MKYYLTWLLSSLLVMVCRGVTHSLATLIVWGLPYFLCRLEVNTCDCPYRCACTYRYTHSLQLYINNILHPPKTI